MKILCVVLIALLLCPGWASCESCPNMTKKLDQLRAEYHRYATDAEGGGAKITFEELVERLDKIVKLKEEMRKAECQVPPSSRRWNEKAKSGTDRRSRQPK